jgi:soluble lytic murein transglycosylase
MWIRRLSQLILLTVVLAWPARMVTAGAKPRLEEQRLKRHAPWNRIAPNIASDQHPKAIGALRHRLKQRLSKLERARARFALAVEYYRVGRYKDTLETLKGLKPWREMGPYIAYYRGGALFQLGRQREALPQLVKVVGCGLEGYALDLRLASHATMEQWGELEALLKEHEAGLLAGSAELSFYRAMLALRKAGAAKKGKGGGVDEAAVGLVQALTHHPGHALADQALDALPAGAFSSSFGEDLVAYRKARRHFDKGRNKEAVRAMRALVDRWKDDHPLLCDARAVLIRACYGRRDYKTARPYLDKRVPACVSHPSTADVLFYGGRILWRLGETKTARKSYARVRELFPEHSYRDDALLYQAMTRKDDGDSKGYVADLEEAVRRYPDDDRHAEILWWLAWHHYKAKAWGEATKWLKKGYEETRAPEFLYWQARLLDRKKKTRGEARERYEAILKAHPLDYYATLAFARLAAITGRGKATKWVRKVGWDAAVAAPSLLSAEELEVAVAHPRHLRFRELWLTGMEGLALAELPGGDDRVGRWLKAQLLSSLQRPDLSHQIVRRELSDYRALYPVRSFESYWRLAYPAPFFTRAQRAGQKVGLVVEIIEAIIREESGFVPDIVSYANAHGLMQLLPSTGKLVAKQNGLPKPSISDLHKPDKNLLLGSLYLEFLVRRFGSPMLAAGAYNAGHGRMDKWLNAQPRRFDLDVFVEDIPYRQARHYVKRVIETYGVYRFLHSKGKRLLLLDLAYDKGKRHDKKASIRKWKPKKKAKKKSKKRRKKR